MKTAGGGNLTQTIEVTTANIEPPMSKIERPTLNEEDCRRRGSNPHGLAATGF